MVVLVSSDDVKYTVDNKAASKSVLIKHMMEGKIATRKKELF